MSETIGRNDPCPCGSGRKYKNCCAGKTRWTHARIAGMPLPALAALVGGIVAVIVVVAFFGPNARRGAARSSAGVPLSAAPSGPTPAPWAYDSTTNKHWDPGHGHWHDGPPPVEAMRGAASAAPGLVPGAGATPAPYQYDPATNRHWDPAHGHWHDGPPPQTPTR
jgi:hypothetical protein